MRLFLFLIPFTAVAAQGVSEPDGRPPSAERGMLVGTALAGGVGAVVGTYAVIPTWYDTPGGVTLLVLAYPAGMAAATLATAEILGLDADALPTITDALLGTAGGALAGVLTGGVVVGLVELASDDEYGIASIVLGGGVGLITTAVVSATLAGRRVRAEPIMMQAPTGDRAPGLSLGIGL